MRRQRLLALRVFDALLLQLQIAEHRDEHDEDDDAEAAADNKTKASREQRVEEAAGLFVGDEVRQGVQGAHLSASHNGVVGRQQRHEDRLVLSVGVSVVAVKVFISQRIVEFVFDLILLATCETEWRPIAETENADAITCARLQLGEECRVGEATERLPADLCEQT